MAASREALLSKRVVSAITKRWPHAFVQKLAGGLYQGGGLPDIIVVVDGRFVGIEMKAQYPSESPETARKRVTIRQAAVLAAIARSGAVSGVAVSVEEAVALVETALEGQGATVT